ncbi:TPA: hypothetical protein NJ543_002040 [Vibrio parahaemolyticus]|uniref:hypothetical protein n=1 Tax=Vibrio parahaemolyticus TaxID=670 RepID=UPI00111F4D3E|nr:hypothetical protein [Vibrio parahaemolyticus]TOP42886.1 hypothetical protein CGH15_14850 [Vibrio parahaemolyticus]HCE1932508.1 hypothetical protein [Vibrio parahaemolyticus]HCG8324194.1 hypothetical protein [Vibrio parahaemolyticus]HCH0713046.1 hypothetical protein [Vibrio parahaemolyticus]
MLDKNTPKFMDTSHELNKVLERARKMDEEKQAEILEEVTKIRLTDQEGELLSHFWHPLRQEVIEEIELSALEHMFSLKRKTKSFGGDDAYKIYRGMFGNNSELFENHSVTQIPKSIKLSKKGVAYVMKQHPIYAQSTLIFLKFWENKFSVVCAAIGFIGSIITIVGV